MVHNLAGSAHAHFVKLKIFIQLIFIIAHQQVQDQLHIFAAQNDNVYAINSFHILNFYDNSRLQSGTVNRLQRFLTDIRRCNIYLSI